jgi:hypothetical protein
VNHPRYSKAALTAALQSCAALVVVCVLTVGFMSSRRSAAEHRDDVAQQHIRGAKARLAQANEHRDLSEKYQDRYDQLMREGLAVRFDRAVAGDWFEAAIPPMVPGEIDHYVIGKDTPYAGPETADLSAFRVISHRLDFAATVSDEDQFADLTRSIGDRVPGTTAQEACSLARNRDSSGGAALLTVRCALIWYEFSAGNTDLAANSNGN